MNQDKAKELLLDYKNCLQRLEEILKRDTVKDPDLIDGTIQRFEFTFEIAWKLMREILMNRGVSVNSPKMTIKEAFREKLFEDGDGWIKMLEDRNLTSHTYKQDLAKEIYDRIKLKHFKLLKDLANQKFSP